MIVAYGETQRQNMPENILKLLVEHNINANLNFSRMIFVRLQAYIICLVTSYIKNGRWLDYFKEEDLYQHALSKWPCITIYVIFGLQC